MAKNGARRGLSPRDRSGGCFLRDVVSAAVYIVFSDDSVLVTGTIMDFSRYPVGAPPNF